VRDITDEVLARPSVIDHVVLLEMLQQGGLDEGDVSLLSKGESLQDRRGVLDGVEELDLGNVEFLGGLDENLSRDALVAELLGHLLGDLFAPAVRAPGDGDDRH